MAFKDLFDKARAIQVQKEKDELKALAESKLMVERNLEETNEILRAVLTSLNINANPTMNGWRDNESRIHFRLDTEADGKAKRKCMPNGYFGYILQMSKELAHFSVIVDEHDVTPEKIVEVAGRIEMVMQADQEVIFQGIYHRYIVKRILEG